MRRGAWVTGSTVIALAILGTIYFTRTAQAPLGQPQLAEMNDATLAALQSEFNRTSTSLRVILLLSPT
jgi:hypothetical protein